MKAILSEKEQRRLRYNRKKNQQEQRKKSNKKRCKQHQPNKSMNMTG